MTFLLLTLNLIVILTSFNHYEGAPLKVDVVHGLMSLYNSTGGAKSWIKNKNWGTAVSYCDWEGITCSGSTFALNQDAGGLFGHIPTEIGYLGGAITGLELNRNTLFSSIPSQIGLLTHLIKLDVQENTLNGTLPTSLASLSNLKMFWIIGNQITGTVDISLKPVLDNCAAYQPVGCRMSGNPFKCPVPSWVPVQCGMGCIN
eukprot:TRINITY_DN6912_c0_g1_i1.p1 TRINITY_DN6912_c0_g1~~TRINITY_DN6912_c0_g1_i1.p1  ORF type:complete len:202 (+),score=35.50 TRINITY_DN6912_c0_g1_i1:77-682(+)